MEPLQNQILILSQKLDALYQLIIELDVKVSQALCTSSFGKIQREGNQLLNHEIGHYQFPRPQIGLNSDFEHKDILTDGMYPELNHQSGDKQITPEIQMQRLTAQLTAAYNRIAALEEQLLKKESTESLKM